MEKNTRFQQIQSKKRREEIQKAIEHLLLAIAARKRQGKRKQTERKGNETETITEITSKDDGVRQIFRQIFGQIFRVFRRGIN